VSAGEVRVLALVSVEGLDDGGDGWPKPRVSHPQGQGRLACAESTLSPKPSLTACRVDAAGRQ